VLFYREKSLKAKLRSLLFCFFYGLCEKRRNLQNLQKILLGSLKMFSRFVFFFFVARNFSQQQPPFAYRFKWLFVLSQEDFKFIFQKVKKALIFCTQNLKQQVSGAMTKQQTASTKLEHNLCSSGLRKVLISLKFSNAEQWSLINVCPQIVVFVRKRFFFLFVFFGRTILHPMRKKKKKKLLTKKKQNECGEATESKVKKSKFLKGKKLAIFFLKKIALLFCYPTLEQLLDLYCQFCGPTFILFSSVFFQPERIYC
jgi:hypothetical protein